jgi:DNA-binding NtrC family response regulator
LTLDLPPLRQRREDTVLLAEHFLGQCEIAYGRGRKMLHPYTLTQLANYGWPGNIRELENFIHREYLMAQSNMIVASPDAGSASIPVGNQTTGPAPTSFKQAKEQAINLFECQYIRTLLYQTSGNVTRAAELAGKERRAFGKLVKKHGIDPKGFAQPS